VLLDHFAPVSQAHHNFADAIAMEQGKLVIDEGFSGQLDQRLWDGLRDGLEARGQAASQEGNRDVGDLQFQLGIRQLRLRDDRELSPSSIFEMG
jgi:hypothetical protein